MTGLQRRLLNIWEQGRYLLFRAPVDTLTTRFMILFLVMLIIPLMTVIFFTVSLMEGHLTQHAHTQMLMSNSLLNSQLRTQRNALLSEQEFQDKPASCAQSHQLLCLEINRQTGRISTLSGNPTSLKQLEGQAPGLYERVSTSKLPLSFFAPWQGKIYLMAAHPAPEQGILLEGQPITQGLLEEVFRDNPSLSTGILLLRETADPHAPKLLAGAGQVPYNLPTDKILARLPDTTFSPEAFVIEKKPYLLAQKFLYGPDNRKLARLVHILPMETQQRLMNNYYSGIYLITVISLLFAVLVAFGAGRTITQPLLQLIGQVNEINRDNLGIGAVSAKGVFEINQLANAFNSMLDRLKQEHKLKDEFVATLTHDLKVPLLAERQTLQYFSSGTYGPLSQEQREVLDALRSANHSSLELVNGLLSAYRYASGEVVLSRDAVDITALAQEVMQELQPLSQEKALSLQLNNAMRNPDIRLYADRLELKRVLHNLLSNAITNTPRRGRVQLGLIDADAFGSGTVYKVSSFQHTTLKAPLILHGRVLISVEDSGIGFSSEDLPNLFRQFAAGQGRHPMSIGLGLFNCNQVVEAHNGSLWVETTEGEGSAVNFLLPQSPEVAADRRKIAHDRRKP